MHLHKWSSRLNRRDFLRYGSAFAGAGVLAPLWSTIASAGDVSKAYPDELLSIESYTRGKIKVGDYITADNVELVKELLDPAKYKHVSEMGRKLKVVATTTDWMKMGPWEYQNATLSNQGMARFDKAGNVRVADGSPWIGGHPFPGSDSALELFAGLTLSWGRHDANLFAMKEYDVNPLGEIDYQYDLVWAELSPVGRLVLEPQPYWPKHRDKLRFNTVVYTSPESERGASYLNVWPYDQNKFPDLYGYVPYFRRIRQFPTNQRFEPLVPGSALYLSDAWAAGDPLHAWGNYKVIGRQPMLAGLSSGWNSDHDNWEHGVHGGPKGDSFFDSVVEMVPEAIICEAEPIGFPRAPISKKRVWFDARNQMPLAMVTFDRAGVPFRSFDGCYCQFENGTKNVMNGKHPYWSWAYFHAYEFQSGRITRVEHVKELKGGHKSSVNDPSIFPRYLTHSALSRLGRA
ncbi:Uncharacterised protein [Zhongshania aliphaticivorans]|uniref:DUF1329 domain-containing protein n=1 Tax=Zhongshania aliphaticivorans TaxID=1470434 RepID=A0A5S9PYF2_9GAMM|nr:DUF1329 domain-containing protein [Zhongshania aliphaticivorans]CAA0092489.1 Uncharacterised protein [Zhongshania aliphaticivorans]CAA0109784.1 Uncharacterised protein [Zhongshania aliphaticivorans]